MGLKVVLDSLDDEEIREIKSDQNGIESLLVQQLVHIK